MIAKSMPTQDPYRSDPTQVAREALQKAQAAHLRLDQLEIDKLQKRVKDLERNSRAQYGFFRTNWNSFWSTVGNYLTPVLVFIACFVGLGVLGYAMNVSTEINRAQAVVVCEDAGMHYVYNSSGTYKVVCIREDGAVVTIVDGEATLSLATANTP